MVSQVPLLMDDDTIAFGEEDETGQDNNKLKYIKVVITLIFSAK